jgi:hypothetical protein
MAPSKKWMSLVNVPDGESDDETSEPEHDNGDDKMT